MSPLLNIVFYEYKFKIRTLLVFFINEVVEIGMAYVLPATHLYIPSLYTSDLVIYQQTSPPPPKKTPFTRSISSI